MSWMFSQVLMKDYANSLSSPEQEAEFLAENSLDGEQYAQLNVMPTQHKFWRNDKTMEFSNLSRFGLTLHLLTENRGEELLMWFLGGFRAKTSALQEKELELQESEADCGRNLIGLLAKWNRNSFMWKIPQLSLFEDLELSLETWPQEGMMRNGECYLVQTAEVFTYESAPRLSLPTPRSCSAMAAQITTNTANAKFPNLETVIARMTIPTIGANEYKGASKKRYINSPDFRGAKMSEGLRTCETDPIYLNPQFAELVMMWPLGWTDLKPLGMDKFQEWLQQHSPYYEKELINDS